MVQLGGDLPDHMRVGRGNMPGPVLGTYVTFHANGMTHTSTDDDTILWACKLPFNFRVEWVSWFCASATADADIELSYNATAAIDASETAMLSAAISLDVATDGIAKATGTTPTLNSAGRNIEAGNYMIIHSTGDDVDSAATNICVAIGGFPYSHVNTDPAND